MGGAVSTLPDTLDKDQCIAIVGDSFSEELWESHSKDGSITKEELCRLATVKAVSNISSEGESGVTGVVNFEQVFSTGPCKITYKITGLKPGLHALTIHEPAHFGEGDALGGEHYNPHNKAHGGPTDEERHAGDLGNIEANADGTAEGELTSNLVALSGDFSVIGRTIIVHEDADDLGKGEHELSSTTGNSGAPIGHGEISKTEAVEVKKGSAMRHKFAKQSSSRVMKAKAEFEEEEDPFAQELDIVSEEVPQQTPFDAADATPEGDTAVAVEGDATAATEGESAPGAEDAAAPADS
mmetsp:Transcript_3023/g.4612  ORF Transcript_3023/g.4612 Transcript_3023/m.4612 type:complete len:297 (+) Transcript_3023:56-946(+)